MLLAACLVLALPTLPLLAHDFGGPTGPGGPPPPDGCPTCCGGGGCGGCGGGGDPVNFWDGAERYYQTDFVFWGFLPVRFARGYDNRSTFDNPMGYGWSHSFDYRLYRFPDGRVVIRKDCGVRREFIFSGGAFVTPVGERGTLIDNLDGTYDFKEVVGYTLKFDVKGRLERIEDPHGTSLRITYDPAGKVPLLGLSPFSPTPAQPRVVAFDYRPLRVEEYDSSGISSGRYYDMAYDPVTGRLTSVTDNSSRTWLFGHDAGGNLETVTDSEGNVITYDYDDPNDVHNLTGVSGGPVDITTTYDTEDRVISQTIGDVEMNITYTIPDVQTDVETLVRDGVTVVASRTETWQFGANGAVDVHIDGDGNETHWTRNAAGQPTVLEYHEDQGGTPVLVESTSFIYDTAGLLMSTAATDVASGETVTRNFTYDGGRLASQSESRSTDPSTIFFRDWLFEHDPGGDPLHIIRYRRQINPGNPAPVYDETTMTYNPDGQVESIAYPGGSTMNAIYTNGFPTDVDGVLYGRDGRGNITSVTVGGGTTSYTYDNLDRVETVTVSGVGTTTYVHSGYRLMQVQHPTHTVDYTYDAVGRLTQVSQTVGVTTTTLAGIAYDKAAGTATLTDAAAGVHVFAWDPLRIWQLIESPETQSPGPSVFTTTNYIGPIFSDPLAEFFARVVDQPGITLPVSPE
jgi:YD repeat-containing protein